MLSLSRKRNESIVIGSGPDAVTVTVLQVERGKVRLGIDAPQHVLVDRKEVRDSRDAEREAAPCPRSH